MSRLTGVDAYGLMEAYQAVYAPQELTEEQVWEEVETWVNSLLEEGYDLSDYTWEEMYENYIEEQGRARTTGQNSSVFTLPTTPGAGSAGGSGSGGRRGSGSSPGSIRPATTPAPTRPAAPAPATTPAPTRPAAPAPATTPAPTRPAAPTPTPAARPAAAPASAKVAPTKPTAPAKPATGMLGKTSFERRTPTSSELKAAQSARASGASPEKALQAAKSAGGALSQSTAASKPATFSPTSAAAKTAPTPVTPKAPTLGSKKPGSMVSHFDPFDVIKGHLLDEGYADTEESALKIMANMSEEWKQSILDEGDNYDKNRQRAAKRAAERNAARDAGKTGNVPGVGYVTSRRERETYRDSGGVERHTSGARMPSKDKKDN
jgi:hypothetical protein